MTPQELKALDHFSTRCWAVHRQPVEQQRQVVARRASLRFLWTISLLTLLSFFSLLAELAK